MNNKLSNKEFFKTLDPETQLAIISTLGCFKEVHVEYGNGKYRVTPHWSLRSSYPVDHKILNEFTAKEFNFDYDYFTEWDKFEAEKVKAGLKKNNNGDWQKEFEELMLPKEKALIKRYLEEK